MEKVVAFLQANPVQYLATVGRDGKAKCRPFMFSFEKDGKLWFNTGNQTDVYKDMQENPILRSAFPPPILHGCVSAARPYLRTIRQSKQPHWRIPS